MATMAFTGVVREFTRSKADARWWAMTDQLPVATKGSTAQEALDGVPATVARYLQYCSESGLPAVPAMKREPGDIEFDIDLPVEALT